MAEARARQRIGVVRGTGRAAGRSASRRSRPEVVSGAERGAFEPASPITLTAQSAQGDFEARGTEEERIQRFVHHRS
ncbi:hypothetical protein [Saccharopolyspora hordei]|uniref:Uncharacterized protein n=1 Tax=Saccharopolyspora hordei TaxID=1838 RepID=A0A853AD18_9PSEU|nr:hypothetical protein [Saccharopolyspora hordei]